MDEFDDDEEELDLDTLASIRRDAGRLVRDKMAREWHHADRLAANVQHRPKVHVSNLSDDEKAEAEAYMHNPPSGPEFLQFCIEVLGYKEMAYNPHLEMCDFAIDLVPDPFFKGEEKRYGLVLVPRDTFKSTVFAVSLFLYILVKNRALRGLLGAYRSDVAEERERAIRAHIMGESNGGKFRRLFSEYGIDRPAPRSGFPWTDKQFTIADRGKGQVTIDPTLDTNGVNKPKVGSHPDLIVIDDAHNRDNVQAKAQRDRVYDYIGGMIPMLQPGGTMIIVGTRWHHNDAYGRIIKDDKENVKQGRREFFKKLIRGAEYFDTERQTRVYYFPTRLDQKRLDDARYAPGMTEYLFRSQYYNETVEKASNLFPGVEDIVHQWDYYYDGGATCGIVSLNKGQTEIPVLTTLAWDPAGHAPGVDTDFHGITVVGMDAANVWWVLAGEAVKDTPNAVIRHVVSLMLTYRPHTVSVESVAGSGTWAVLLQNYINDSRNKFPYLPRILPIKPSSRISKLNRIDTAVEPLFAQKRIRIHETNADDLLAQMMEYPQIDNFDVIDSLAQHGQIVQAASPQIRRDFYDADMAEYMEKDDRQIFDERRRLGCYTGAHAVGGRLIKRVN